MPVKSRTVEITRDCENKIVSDLGNVIYSSSRSYTRVSRSETIDSVNGSKKDEHPVTHSIERGSIGSCKWKVRPSGGTVYTCSYDLLSAGLWKSAYYTVPQQDLAYARAQAARASVPRLQPELSLVNFILEMREFNKLFQFFDKRHGITRNLSSGTLNWNFGWKPLIADLCTVIEKFRNVDYFYDYIQSTRNKPVDCFGRHVVKGTVSGYKPLQSFGFMYSWSDNQVYANGMEWSLLATSKHTLQFLPIIRTFEWNLRAYMQLAGVMVDPSIVWNAIPLSFVVDWFIPIGQELQKFAIDTLQPEFNTLGRSSATKLVTVTPLYTVFGNDQLSTGAWTGGRVGEAVTISYKRINDATLSAADYLAVNPELKPRVPNGKQLFLGANLLYQRI